MAKKKTEKIEKALNLVEREGYSYRRAAKAVGLNRGTVERAAKREGVVSPRAAQVRATKEAKLEKEREEKQRQEQREEELRETYTRPPTLWQRIKEFFGFY